MAVLDRKQAVDLDCKSGVSPATTRRTGAIPTRNIVTASLGCTYLYGFL